MGQAVSWAGAQWVCSWRLPDGPGWQLGGCTMGVQLAVARWARLAAGGALWACSWRLNDGPGWQLGVHYGGAAGGCPMGQAGSWGCTMGVQLAVARWARLAAGGVLWACSWRLPDGPGWQLGVYYGRAAGGCPMGQAVSWACYGYPGALPRMPDTHDMQARSISHTKFMVKANDVAQIIYIYIQISYKHSFIYAHILGIICHMMYSYTTMAVERGAYEHNKIQKGLLWYMWMSMTRGCRSTLWLPCHQQQNLPHQQCIHRLTDIIQVINQERQKNHGASLHIKAIYTHNKET